MGPSGVEGAIGALRAPHLVLARARVRLALFPVERIPVSAREQALRLHLLQISPYARTGFAWHVRGATAYAWYWDETALDAALAPHNLSGRFVRPVPEPLLRQRGPDGFALNRTLDGVEGQFRAAGSIEASSWWPASPDAAEWAHFARDVGGAYASAPCPPLAQPAWLAEVPPELRIVRAIQGETRFNENLIYFVLLALLGCGAIWLGMAQWRLVGAIAERTAERAALRQELGHILDDQRAAERDRTAVTLRAANEHPLTQLDLLAAFAALGIGEGQKITLTEWDFRNDKLRAVLTATTGEVARTEMLARAERIPGLHNVRLQIENDPKSFTLIADVARSAEPPDAAASLPTASAQSGTHKP